MPKKLSSQLPRNSMTMRNPKVATAIFLAKRRYTSGASSPTNPRNTSADPIGLMSGSSAVKARMKDFENSI